MDEGARVRSQISRFVSIGLLALLAGCGGGGGGSESSVNPPPPPVADTIPSPFSIPAENETALATAVTSDPIVISGIDSAAPVTITGGEYSIDGGPYTAAPGTISNNQKIQIRATSPQQFSTPLTVVLTVGGVSASFTVTTMAADTTPDAFQFQSKADATRHAWVASTAAAISGINTSAPITIENGEYAIDGGAFTSAAGSINEGQSLAVRAKAGATYSKITRARVTVGSVTADFEVTSELPDYVPDSVVYDGLDIVYLLNSANKLVFRWSIADERYLDAYAIGLSGLAPTKMAYSGSHRRLYLGYSTGAIQYIDVTSGNGSEVPFANTATGVNGLTAAGNYVLAQDGSGAWATHYVFNTSGAVTDQKDWNRYSREYAWDPATSRIYFFRDDTSPNDLHYEVIDQTTGKITSAGETPYHGSYTIQPPIRVSTNGRHVLLGGGDIYNQSGLTWSGSLGSQVTDARWFADGSLVTLTTASNQTALRRLGTNLVNLEQRTYTGQALRVVGTDAKMVVLVVDDSTVQFHTYVPNDDSDGDGVTNTQDAFPLDAAASVDSDHDGYPNAWNAGKSQSDSTSGLSLDAYPQDAACYRASHGDGVHCNYAATIPSYVPDQVINDGDIVYLLSSANRHVYRWSIATGTYLNPYVVEINQGFSTLAPTKMAYSGSHKRLYLGYSTGAIQYIDVTGSGAGVPFANTAMAVNGLAAVGNYVLAQDGSGGWGTHYVFNASGVVTDQKDLNRYSREYAWDPVTSRVYFFRDDTSPNDLHYEVINQATGKITSAGETPYHGSYTIQPPIRVSANGQYVLLGGGDIYSQSALTWSGSLGSQIADARWFADGSLVTLTTASNQTVLRRLGTNLVKLEQLTYTGQALRVVGTDAKMAVLVIDNGTVQFKNYVPNNDSDGDGVTNTQDAFPLDAAASVDSDHDGYPNAWNAGKSQSDSTSGLSLDAYPQDSACYLVAHGNGVTCNYGATIPNYVPDQIISHGDTVYLLSSANKRVYRWSIATGAYLNPYVVGINQGFSTLAPTKMAYSSSHQRLYLGYSTGAIQYIDVSAGNGSEVPFANTAMGVNGLAAAGSYLLVQDGSGAWATHYVFNAGGVVTEQKDWNRYSREYAWDPVTSRVYFFRDDTSPNDLHYEVIDQATGKITSAGETPYHGSYTIQPPIRVSASGQYVLLGGGDIYNQSALTWSGSLGSQIADARWFADGSLVTLTTASNQTALRRLGTNLVKLEQLTYTGQALRVVGTDAKMAVLVINNSTVQFHIYVPDNDSDDDGVLNTQDAFPLDAAASVDTDHDGYPNAWNAGKSQSDSTSGLSLDAYPQDSACYLVAHGNGVTCNYGATVPNYVPDQVINEGDTVYLLSSANKRVYRWSIATGAYLNPYVVGINQGFSTLAPTRMAYSSSHQRLYLGYSTGAIQYVDVTGSGAEVPFANTAMAVNGLAAVGNYVLAQDGSGAWATHYVFNASGVVTDQEEWNYYSPEYAWDPVTSRVYFFRDHSPGDLHFEVIDQATGQISAEGETPYHGSYGMLPPIRVSPAGQRVLLGSGDIYNQSGLTWSGSLGTQLADARWFADGSLVTLTTASNQTALRRLGTNLVKLEQLTYTGQALRVVGSDAKMAVLVINSSTVQFHIYVPNNDSDGDGVTNTQDAFPLDAAASVDSDHDGYPNAWNAGKSQSDSTTGLSLDAYPQDSACYLLAHGNGVTCNYGATIPNYVPDQVVNHGDTVYLLSSANKRVYRWSIAAGTYLNPYVVGIDQGFSTLAPTKMAYSSSHQRLYLSYSTGAIQYIDVTGSGVEVPFANTAMGVNGLVSVGNYVLAQDGSGAWATHYVFNASGVVTDQKDWNHYSSDYAWDPVSSRVYFFRDGTSPNDLHFEVIDQATGEISSEGETPYHGTYNIQPPVRVSTDGQYVLLGTGDIYKQSGLTWSSSLGKAIKDAHWKDNLLVDVDTSDRVEIRDADTRAVLISYQYLGQPIRLVFGQSDAYLVHVMNNTTAFVRLAFGDQDQDSVPQWWEQVYGLSDSNAADALDDPDGDGVNNAAEYLNRSSPIEVDSDSDGLTDHQEIHTYATNPARADSDGDGLNDEAEVVTYQSDPWDADTDGDGYTDFDESLYGGDLNDPAGLPQPLLNYIESFENNPLPAAWTTPQQSSASWTRDSAIRYSGSASLKSGAVAHNQSSGIRFRGFFSTGQLSFYSRVESDSCCDRLNVLVDGVQVLSVPVTPQWTRLTVPIALGLRNVEWQFQKDWYGTQGADAAWIDDVAFVGQ
jgi:hypothetical protein